MLREVSTTFKKLMDKKWKEFAHPCSWGPVRSHGREQGKCSNAAQEVKKLSREEAQEAAEAVMEEVIDPKSMPRKCRFADILNCPGAHPPWSCEVSTKLVPEERNRIILDNEICSFCLLHREDDVSYRRGTDRKAACVMPDCKGGQIKWLPIAMKVKLMSMKVVMNT
jgi:hypothetical protein